MTLQSLRAGGRDGGGNFTENFDSVFSYFPTKPASVVSNRF